MPSMIRNQADADAYVASIRNRPASVSAVNFTTGQPTAPVDWNHYADTERDRVNRMLQSRANHNRLVRIGQFATAAPFAVAGGAALAGGALGSGAAGGAATGYSSPGVFSGLFGGAAGAGSAATTAAGAGGMTLGNVWNLANLGVGATTSLLGMRSTNRAADRQMQLQQREIDARLAADAEARAEARRQFDIQQANETRRIASDDEDRRFQRSRQEYELQLVREREARNQVRRQRLAAFLGLGN